MSDRSAGAPSAPAAPAGKAGDAGGSSPLVVAQARIAQLPADPPAQAPARVADTPAPVAGNPPSSPADDAPAAVQTAQPATTTRLDDGRIVVDAPQRDQTLFFRVEPETSILLADEAFDPDSAIYAVSGRDLVVRTGDDGILLLESFFATVGGTAFLSVLGGPAVGADVLLGQAVTAAGDVSRIEPAADAASPAQIRGNASFAQLPNESIGDGLDPLGPLDPTALGGILPPIDIANFDALADLSSGSDDDDGNGPSPPRPPIVGSGPVITADPTITGTITADSRGFNPPGNQALPEIIERQRVPDSEVNGLPNGFVTPDADREIFVTFRDEVALFRNSLLVYELTPGGELVNARMVFPDVNDFDAEFNGETLGPLEPGETVSIGTVAAGTTFGFLLLRDGATINGDILSSPGTFEIRNGATGETLNIADNEAQTEGADHFVVHIAPDGTETRLGGIAFFSADASQGTPNSNRLNDDGLGHFVSGFDSDAGEVVFGIEDLRGPAADRDFNDAVFSINFAEANDGDTVFIGTQEGRFNAVVEDPDSDTIVGGTVAITEGALPGDRLFTDEIDRDQDGTVDGTQIEIDEISEVELSFSGQGSIEDYTAVLNGIRFGSESDAPQVGTRTIEASLTDADGNTGEPALIEIVIGDQVQDVTAGTPFIGTDASEAIQGTTDADNIAGAAGDDLIAGRSGEDIIAGDDGDDLLVGGSAADTLTGGAGADIFAHTGLSDGRDTITDFNSGEGDRLDLTKLFEGSAFDPDSADASSFLRFEPRDLDGSGSADDLAVIVDLDGTANAFTPQTIILMLSPSVPAGELISAITTFEAVASA